MSNEIAAVQEPEAKPEAVSGLNGAQRSAILLMSLGEEDAAKVLKHMGPKEVQKIGLAMAELSNVQRETMIDVLDLFLDVVEDQTGIGIGSEDYIRNTLRAALGDEKADSIVDRILMGANTKGLDTLKWMDPKAVADVIQYEHPQIQSIVLAYLDADQAAEILAILPEQNRLDLTLRICSLDSIHPQALQELNDIMEKQFSGQSSTKSAHLGGIKSAADIMNYLDTAIESQLIEAVKEVDEDLGQNIQDLMFVFDNLVDVDDRGIQTLLREISTDTLILALKGADDEVNEKIFGNMSKRAAELLRDDLEAMGPVRLSDVETAQKEILTVARRLAESGEISLGGSGEEMV